MGSHLKCLAEVLERFVEQDEAGRVIFQQLE